MKLKVYKITKEIFDKAVANEKINKKNTTKNSGIPYKICAYFAKLVTLPN